MNILWFKNFNEVDKNFAKRLLDLSARDSVEVVNFKQEYNLSYIGEVAERFISRNLIKNVEQLVSLILVLSRINVEEQHFQVNQKQIFINNVFEWIKEKDNELSIKNKVTLYSSLLYFMYYTYNSDEMENLIFKKLKEELSLSGLDNYWFEFILIAINKYCNKERLVTILKKLNPDLTSLTFKKILLIMQIIFPYHLRNNREDFLSRTNLKVADIKDNKQILKILKALKKISNSEIKEYDAKNLSETLNLSEIEIFILNIKVCDNSLSTPAEKRVKNCLFKNYICSNEKVDEEVLEIMWDSDCGLDYYEKRSMFNKNYDNIINLDVFKDLITRINVSDINYSTIIKILKDNAKFDLIEINMKRDLIIKSLEFYDSKNTIQTKEDFDFLLNLKEKYEIELDADTYITNLIKYKYIDISNIDYVIKNNYSNLVINYLEYNNKLEMLIYTILCPFECLNKNLFDIESNIKYLDDLEENLFKPLALKYKFTEDTNLLDIEYKQLLINKFLYKSLEYIALYDCKSYAKNLYYIVTNKYNLYLELPEEEILKIKKVYFDNKLVDKEEMEILNKLFLTEEEVFKIKIDDLIKELNDETFFMINYYNRYKFKNFTKSNLEYLNSSEDLRNEYIRLLKENINSQISNNWETITIVYFILKNSNINREFIDTCCSIINNGYLKIKSN